MSRIRAIARDLMMAIAISVTPCAAATMIDLSYSGRIVDATGMPLAGPIDVTIRFFNSPNGTTQLGEPKSYQGVTLIDGVLQLTISLNEAQQVAIFGNGTDQVYLEVEAAGTVYPRQLYTAVPLALRARQIPVDNNQLVFSPDTSELKIDHIEMDQVRGLATALANNSLTSGTSTFTGSGGVDTIGPVKAGPQVIVNGNGTSAAQIQLGDRSNAKSLTLKTPSSLSADVTWILPSYDGTNGQLLKTDGIGNLSWTSPITHLSVLSQLTVNCPVGQILKSDGGGTWSCQADADSAGPAGLTPADGSVSTSKLVDGAVTAVKLNSMGCQTNQILKYNGSVWACANENITSNASLLNSGTIDPSLLPTTVSLLGSMIEQSEIADNAIATNKLAANAVNSDKILDGSIVNADIASLAAIADSKLATISTAGKVANSATSATSTNTPSAIVTRDTSGNFTAGTITASLNGNATTATTAGNVTGTVEIRHGGTGATTVTEARSALNAAASGANTDITSLSGLTTAISVAQGGTGATALGANAVLLGNGVDAVQSVPAGASGNVLTSNGATWISSANPGNSWTASEENIYRSSGNIGIGTMSPLARLDIRHTSTTSEAGTIDAMNVEVIAKPSAASSQYTTAGEFNSTSGGSSDLSSARLYGLVTQATHKTSSTLGLGYGLVSSAVNYSGTMSSAVAMRAIVNNQGSGTIGSAFGLHISAPLNSGDGMITNYYGLFINTPTTATSNYAIYSQGGTNYFGGNIGIGTTGPRVKLELDLSDSSPVLGANMAQVGILLRNRDTTTNNWNVIEFNSASGGVAASIGAQIKDHTNHYGEVAIATRGPHGWGERMRITSSGNVGIGTKVPSAPLTIAKSTGIGASSDLLRLNSVNSSAGNGSSLAFSNNADVMTLARVAAIDSGTWGGHLAFATAPSTGSSPGGTPTEQLRITSSGNVGIGTTSPAGKLDVAGSICLNGANCITSWPAGSVTAVSAGTGLTGGPITSSGSLSLANTSVTPGSYTRANITVDAQGRLTAAANGNNVALATEVTGTLPVANGGTGATSTTSAFNTLSPLTTLGDILYGGTSGAGTRLAGNTAATKQFLTSTGSGGLATAPAWGALNASDIPAHSAALITSGTLAVANGGTGASTLAANHVLLGNGTSAPLTVAPGSDGNILTSNGTTWVSSAPASNSWTTSGSDVYRSGGKVGIGTTAPGASLDVNGSVRAGSITVSTSSAPFAGIWAVKPL